jgi:hypothetical protein
MAFQVSPGVLVQEKDLTTIIPNVSTSIGAIVIEADKGPADEIIEVSSEKQLVDTFGEPNSTNAPSWYTAANFLKYSGALKVVRSISNASKNSRTGTSALIDLKNSSAIENHQLGAPSGLHFIAKTPGEWGNSLKVDVCPSLGGKLVTAQMFGDKGVNITQLETNEAYPNGIPWLPETEFELTVLGGTAGKIKVKIGSDGSLNHVEVVAGSYGSGYIPSSDIDYTPLGRWDSEPVIVLTTSVIAFDDVEAGSAAISGQIQSTVITTPGTDYDNGTHDLSITGGTGGTVRVTVAGNEVTNLELLTGGYAYAVGTTTALNITIPSAIPAGTPGSGFAATMLVVDIPEVPAITTPWKYGYLFDNPTGTSSHAEDKGGSGDELYIVVSDFDGKITGVPGTILEKWQLSKASDARSVTGENLYYVDILKKSSEYIIPLAHGASDWGSESSIDFDVLPTTNTGLAFSGGVVLAPSNGNKYDSLQLFSDADTVDLNLVMSGDANKTFAQYVINLAHKRKDCLAFISPRLADVVGVPKSAKQTTNVKEYFDGLMATSYAVFDSGWKYQYDTYHDVYRWVPLNGDMAGLCANTDDVADPWFSPAGMSRGNVKSVIKLAFNPKKNERDTLYKARINPVVTFPGMGTLLWGDKTAQSKASAFDRINVRRLFMVLEKSISIASRAQLFELNDDVTRSNFVAMTEPFLRDVQGRRGITDFKVVCDTSNNTGDVIDRNEFRADIYIKPARSINFITLTFVATRTGVSFSEVGA